MSYLTVEVDIDHGRIVAREPHKLPEKGNGLLTILEPAGEDKKGTAPEKAKLPLIGPDGTTRINPTGEQLDASLWGDQTR